MLLQREILVSTAKIYHHLDIPGVYKMLSSRDQVHGACLFDWEQCIVVPGSESDMKLANLFNTGSILGIPIHRG